MQRAVTQLRLLWCAGQVGGRVVAFDGLTFSTVRAAGHMVSLISMKIEPQIYSRCLVTSNS